MGSAPLGNVGVFRGFSSDVGLGVGSSASSSLVLDEESGELVASPAKMGKKGGAGAPATRAALALRSHSEAERRRRERINSHLATLRSMVPCTDKLDKAALLAEVISHVKELKTNAIEASKGCTVPSDIDEVRVEVDGDGMNGGSFLIKASLSCEDRPELLADLRQTIQSLQLNIVGAEISTLGGRVKHVLVLTCKGNPDDSERNLFATSVHQALNSVLDRTTVPDFLLRTPFPGKRQRISPFESSCSSS